MEALQTLEKKVQALIEQHQKNCATIEELRQEVSQAKEEKQRVEQKLEQVENQLLSQYQSDEDREQAKHMVDELIKNIDSVIHEDAQNG